VRSRRNPITGSLVVADVVLKRSADLTESEKSKLRHDILKICRDQLPRHKVPTVLNVVPVLNVASSGKVARYNA